MAIPVVTDSSSRSAFVKTGDVVEGRYRIVRTLGTGSLGTVYLAEHVQLKRRVAIKIVQPELIQDAAILDAFMAEARAAGTLGHPNIAECTDIGFTAARVPYLVLEYLEGSVLTDEIYRLGGLPVRRAIRIADQIAAALQAAHDAGIVHRDLTSDSVFVVDRSDARDVVKVIDFGVAHCRAAPDARGAAGGTPEFMAPEQLTGGAVDRRADLYALGVILYEMLTARRPFSDDDRRSLVHLAVHEPPPPLQRPDAPPELEELIVARLLAKSPDLRPASMSEVRTALAAFAAPPGPRSGEIAAARPESVAPEAVPPPGLPATPLPLPAEAVALPALASQRSPRLVLLFAAAVAAAGGGGAMYVESQTRAAAEQSLTTALDGDAEKLAGLIETEARAAHLRADGVAAMPMLRAAIETDAATIKDMFGSDFLFTPRPREVLELFQMRDRGLASMLRIPDTAAAVAPVAGNQTRIASDGATITVVAGAPVARQKAGIGGAVAIAMPLDLAPIARRLAEHARAAMLVGFGEPLPLIPPTGSGRLVSVPVPLSTDLRSREIALSVVVSPASARPELRVIRLACWALGGVLLALFTANLLRGRKPE
jgi:tRNA A-37 threonylcarbamoyl transferase component Bud32